MNVAVRAIAERAERALEVGHIADQRRAIGAQRLLETEVAGLAPEIAGLEQLELADLPPVVVCPGLDPFDRVHDQIGIAERREVGARMTARNGHDRRQILGRDRLVRECPRRSAS
jgi:hypothetical protein